MVEEITMARIHETLSGHGIKFPDPDPKLERFLRRVQETVDDEKASEDSLVALIYGRENPILDQTVFPTRGAVTREVLENPVYQVLVDQIARKRVALDGSDPKKIARKFTISTADAAELKGVSEDALRKAAREGRVPSWKRDGSYFFEPKSLEAAELGTRGPMPAATEPLEVSYGFRHVENAFLKVKKDGLKVAEITPEMHRGAGGASCLDLTVDRWRRIGVLTGVNGKLRFFVLVPGTTQRELEFHGFYVRGKFEIDVKINNPKAARETWEAFRAS